MIEEMTEYQLGILYIVVSLILPLFLSIFMALLFDKNKRINICILFTFICTVLFCWRFAIEKEHFIKCNKWEPQEIQIDNINVKVKVKDTYDMYSDDCFKYNITFTYKDTLSSFSNNTYSNNKSFESCEELRETKTNFIKHYKLYYNPENPNKHIDKNSYCRSCEYPHCINNYKEKPYTFLLSIILNFSLQLFFWGLLILDDLNKK